MTFLALRGISRVTAAATGLLLVYGSVYTTEAMTTRIPMSPLRELGVTTLCMLPWTMLLCSGLDDFGAVTRQSWAFWAGVTLALSVLYYFESSMSSSLPTKVAMPVLAMGLGLLPHLFRRISFVYTIFSIAFGIAGLVVFCLMFATFLSTTGFLIGGMLFFSLSRFTELVLAVFVNSSLAVAILSVSPLARLRPPIGKGPG